MFLRWFFPCFLVVCFGCNTLPSEHLQTFQNALSAFDAEDYPLSINLYQQLLKDGVRSGAVYYNLGNAYVKADKPLHAIATYYLARRYTPNDPHLNANLLAVLTDNGGLPPSAENSLIDSLLFWQNSVGLNAKMWGALLLATSTFVLGGIHLFRQFPLLKRCFIASAMLTVIALVSVGYDWYRYDGVEQVIVAQGGVPRKGNSEEYLPTFVSPVPFGTRAVILDERGGWYLLRFSNGQEGWLPQSQMIRVRETMRYMDAKT